MEKIHWRITNLWIFNNNNWNNNNNLVPKEINFHYNISTNGYCIFSIVNKQTSLRIHNTK